VLLKGNCTPKIALIAKETKEPSTTIHYNIKKMESEGIIKAYRAVFDYKTIDKGYCTFLLLTLSTDEYGDPEKIGRELLGFSEIESVDICTGDWEIILKVRTKDQDEYYQFVRNLVGKKGIERVKTLTSLKQLKTEFVNI
jgi:Lrp/AsnC family leucine-responsive transcriptional regulator